MFIANSEGFPVTKLRRRRHGLALSALACIFGFGFVATGMASVFNRDALWAVVGLCVLNQTKLQNPAPCAEVNLANGEENGSAILKDLWGKTQFLLIPTRRVTGIEDPLIGARALPNYWAAAWSARRLVEERLGKELPRNAIGMAINSVGSRSQDQLHIHIDCVRPDVRLALESHAAAIRSHWADLPFSLVGQFYRARRIEGSNPEPDPFRLLREDASASGIPMREETLAVIGAQFGQGKEGFFLLANHARKGAQAHAENLLDHSCALARLQAAR